jgi:hypothetical protein
MYPEIRIKIMDNKFIKEELAFMMDEMDDLPDGAFFAMANDLGLEPEDFITEESTSER